MSKFSMDTDKVREAGENIVKDSEEFNKVVDDIFMKLGNLEKDGAWVGDNANSSVRKYMEIVASHKEAYSEYAVTINSLGKKLIEYANDVSAVASEKIKEGLCQ